MRQTIQSLQDFGTRFMLAPNRKEVANWIREKYISLGINNTVIDSFQTHSVFICQILLSILLHGNIMLLQQLPVSIIPIKYT